MTCRVLLGVNVYEGKAWQVRENRDPVGTRAVTGEARGGRDCLRAASGNDQPPNAETGIGPAGLSLCQRGMQTGTQHGRKQDT